MLIDLHFKDGLYEYFTEKGFSHTQKIVIVGDLNCSSLAPKLLAIQSLKILCSLMTAFGLCEMFYAGAYVCALLNSPLLILMCFCQIVHF